MNELRLDDYGMLLLEKTREAHEDLCVAETARSDVAEGRLVADRFYWLSSSVRERDSIFLNLSIEFAGQVWMLEAYSVDLHTHQLSHHVTLTAGTMVLFDQLREYVENDGPGSLAVAYLKDTVIPAVFEDAKRGLS